MIPQETRDGATCAGGCTRVPRIPWRPLEWPSSPAACQLVCGRDSHSGSFSWKSKMSHLSPLTTATMRPAPMASASTGMHLSKGSNEARAAPAPIDVAKGPRDRTQAATSDSKTTSRRTMAGVGDSAPRQPQWRRRCHPSRHVPWRHGYHKTGMRTPPPYGYFSVVAWGYQLLMEAGLPQERVQQMFQG